MSFAIITIALSMIGFIGYQMLILTKKAELFKCYAELQEIYDLRKKQKNMLGDVASSYFNSMSKYSQKAMSEIDTIIAEVKEVVDYAESATKFSSLKEIYLAISIVSKFNKRSVKANKKTAKDIKNTWETNAQELVSIVVQEISDSSAKHKALGYKVPSARIFRKPTELALQELKALLR